MILLIVAIIKSGYILHTAVFAQKPSYPLLYMFHSMDMQFFHFTSFIE